MVLGVWVGVAPAGHAVDKSGVTPNTVSLPQGPGSIRGLGEMFEPAMNTGTAKHEVPLAVPAGPAGHAPRLVLEYDTGNGNGPLGYGWKLDVPLVQRRSSYGLPRYLDGPNGRDDDGDGETDEPDEVDKIINGAENLIPQADGFYFRQREGAFIRYRCVGDHWEGTLPDGTLQEFGLTAQARVVDPSSPARIFLWMLERQTDRHGNTIEYSYRSFPSEENANQVYLSKVAYGPGAPPWENYHFVVFEYEPRPDWFESCRSRFAIRTGMRLSRIVVGTQGPTLEGHAAGDFDQDGQTDYLNRTYQLQYEAHPHWSLLTSVTEGGADGVSTLPPVTFGYNVVVPASVLSASSVTIGSVNTPLHVMDKDWVDLTDLNGDGLPDILKTEPFGGVHSAILNEGETGGEGGRAIVWGDATPIGGDARTWSVSLDGDSGVLAHLADMNGDGRADLVHKAGRDVYYFPNEVGPGVVAWGERTRMHLYPETAIPPSPFETPHVKTADLNADKLFDIIQSISVSNQVYYRVWINLGGQRFSKSITVAQAFGFMLSDAHIHVADFNGDGLPDIVRITPTGLQVAPGLGYGAFALPVAVVFSDVTLTTVQLDKARLSDVTGDGLVDLVIERAAPGQLWYWLNKGNYTLDVKRVIKDTPVAYGAVVATRWADLNGNGTTDLVYADDYAEPRLQVIDIGELIGCVPSPLLIRIDNGIGRKTDISYATSTKFLLEDAAAGMPWPDPMPFPVDVVSEVTTGDSLGNVYVTKLRYHDGLYHIPFRCFTGFARAEETCMGDPTAPTQVTRFEFDTGRDVFHMRGKVLRQTVAQDDGAVFSDEVTQWDARVLMTGVDGREVIYPNPVAQTRDILERGQGTARRIEGEFTYDDYGNLIVQREFGIVEAEDRGGFADERITETEFAYNLDDWLVRFPIRREVADLAGTVIARTEFYYDDATFSGENLGEVTVGDQTLVRKWRDPNDPVGYVDAERVRYDAYGNPIVLLDPLAAAPGVIGNAGHYRTIEYDARFHTFPVTEIIHIGGGKDDLVIRATYDEGFGAVTSSVNFNGFATAYGYDAFARFIWSVRPGDTADYPTLEYEYRLAEPVGDGGLVNFVEVRLLDREPGSAGPEKGDHYFILRRFVDGLGQKLMEKKEAEPNPDSGGPRVAVMSATRFNARMTPAEVLQPFYSMLSGDDLDALLAYEDIGAPGWQGLFHEGGRLVALGYNNAHKVVTEYDATLRPVRIVNADGTYRRMLYEPLMTTTFDENDTDSSSTSPNTPVVQHRDGLGRLVCVDEIVRLNDDGAPSEGLNTWTTRYAYRADGVLTRIADSQGNEKWMEYDGLKRRTYMNDPNRGAMHYTCDDASNLIQTVDANNQRITCTYDGANRRLTEDYHDEGQPFSFNRYYNPASSISDTNRPDVAYYYDDPAGPIDLGNGRLGTATGTKGFLAYVVDLAGEEHNSYDARGRTQWVVKRIPDPITGRLVSYKTEMTYDPQDRIVDLIYPDEDRCTYHYNEGNLTERIAGGTTANWNATPFILSGAEYTPSGQRRQSIYGNGVTTRYAYDSRGRLSSIITAPPSNPPEPLMDYAYVYDPVSNISAIHDRRSGTVRGAGDPRRNTQFFRYDDRYRITNVQFSFNLPAQPSRDDGQIAYRYDRIGNMLAKTSGVDHTENGRSVTHLGDMGYGDALGAWNRIGRTTADAGPHALTSAHSAADARAFSYDANGNVTDLDGLECTWDFRDRLVAAADDTMRAEYVYDYSDRRIVKKVWRRGENGTLEAIPSTVVQYIGEHFEVREHGQPTKYVFDGDTRVAKLTGTLDPTAQRVQRFRLSPGWNLLSVAVEASDAAVRLGVDTDPNVEAVFKLDRDAGAYAPVDADTPLPAGSILWVRVGESAVVSVVGDYADPADVTVALEKGLVAVPGLEALSVDAMFTAGAKSAWGYEAHGQRWRAAFGDDLDFLTDLPDFVKPGQPVFLDVVGTSELTLPPPAQRIQYYHQDHLGSSNVVADAQGRIVEETTFYPFGEPRHRFVADAAQGALGNPYLYSQKERDRETDLDYFEARYLAAPLGRFNRVDPAATDVPVAALADPQLLNAYSFARSNPIAFQDPEGQFITTAAGRTLMRQFNPFSDQSAQNTTDTRAERRARVFGALKVKKGGKLPEGPSIGSIPSFAQRELDRLKKQATMGPNQLISSVAQVAEGLMTKFEGGGKDKLNASRFLKALTMDPSQAPSEQKKRLEMFGKLLGGGDLAESPITEGGKLIDEGASAAVQRLMNTVKMVDLRAKYEKFSGILEKRGFEFKQAEVDEFIEKYLDLDEGVEDPNRGKDNRKRDED